MDPATGELQEALDAERSRLIEDMLLSDPAFRDWYLELIYQQAKQRLLPVAAPGKLYNDKASGREIDMQVIATVGNIDPTSVCEDPNCEQRGEMFKDHKVVHKAKGGKKGLRGTCPECQGPMHNERDDARLIAFACLWRQAFGSDARKTPVSAVNLATVVKMIQSGKITKWADRNLMHTILAPKAVAAGGTGSAAPVAPTPAAAPATSTPPTRSTPASATTPATVPTPKAADPDKQRKLREMLKGARVQP